MGHAHDAVHGGAYLVAHVCQKNAFGGIGGFGSLLGLAQDALVLPCLRHIADIAGNAQHPRPAHNLIGQRIPAQALAWVGHPQIQVLLPASRPPCGVAQFTPLGLILACNARPHELQPGSRIRGGIDAKLLIKNIIAGDIQTGISEARYLKNSKPTQAAGKRKPHKPLAQALMRFMQFRHILMVPDNPHHIILIGADAPPAAAHRHQAHGVICTDSAPRAWRCRQ